MEPPGSREKVAFEVLTGPGLAHLTGTLWRSRDDTAWAALDLTVEDEPLLSCVRLLVDSASGPSREARWHPASQGLLIRGQHGELLGTMAPDSAGRCVLRRPGHANFSIEVWPDSRLVTGTAPSADGAALVAFAAPAEGSQEQLQLDLCVAEDSSEAPILLIAVLGTLAFQPSSGALDA